MYESIRLASGIDKPAINAAFDDLKVKRAYPDMIANGELLLALERQRGDQISFEGTCWFHLGRTVPDVTFEEGILPLGDAMPQIWNMLYNLLSNFPKEKWLEFRRNMESGFPDTTPGVRDYRLKAHNKFHWGPFAYLILESAFNDYHTSRIGTHYWDGPEVVDNICRCFSDRHSVDLLKAFQENTKPYVVKFIDYTWESKYLANALRYLYLTYLGDYEDCVPTMCYDGQAKKVAPEHILEYRFVAL